MIKLPTKWSKFLVSIFAATLILLISFKFYEVQTDLNTLPNKSELVALSIDAAINEGRENTYDGFWIDYSSSNLLDSVSKNECTSLRGYLTEINADSLFDSDTTWKSDGYLKKGVFIVGPAARFGNTIKIEINVTYALLAGKGFEITLEKIGNHYRVIEQRITMVS